MRNILFKILKYSFIIISVTILLIIGYITFGILTLEPDEFVNPKDYKLIKGQMLKQNELKHFPDEIPTDATEIYFYAFKSTSHKAEWLILNFKTNKNFIENELKKNEFWNKNDKLTQKQNIYIAPQIAKDFNEKNYIYYAINYANDTDKFMQEYFPGFNWVGVDMKNNKIMYCHIVPSD